MVLAPRVRVGLFANRLAPVPKEGVLVVVVPNPAGLLPKRFCDIKTQVNHFEKTQKKFTW